VDLHCDETDDPLSRHIETLTYETQRLGLGGRVTGSHLTSMHSMDNYYVSKLLPLMAEAGVAAIANPNINITIQGRHDTYPKRRGMNRFPEILSYGITAAFGQDCMMVMPCASALPPSPLVRQKSCISMATESMSAARPIWSCSRPPILSRRSGSRRRAWRSSRLAR
jgi:hypothetical protein